MSTDFHLQHHPARGTHPLSTVLITHGYGEHAGRYSKLIISLNTAGIDVFTYEQRGHGEVFDQKAPLCVDTSVLISDHLSIRHQVEQEKRTESLLLFGHSLGGLVTSASVLARPTQVDGIILSSPALIQRPSAPRAITRLLRLLANVAPQLPITKLNPALLSRDHKVIQEYLDDPKVYNGKVSLLTGSSMALSGYQVLDNLNNWPKVPTLVIHGEKDALIPIVASEKLVAAARKAGAATTFVPVPYAYHEVFNELEGVELTQQLCNWIKTNTAIS